MASSSDAAPTGASAGAEVGAGRTVTTQTATLATTVIVVAPSKSPSPSSPSSSSPSRTSQTSSSPTSSTTFASDKSNLANLTWIPPPYPYLHARGNCSLWTAYASKAVLQGFTRPIPNLDHHLIGDLLRSAMPTRENDFNNFANGTRGVFPMNDKIAALLEAWPIPTNFQALEWHERALGVEPDSILSMNITINDVQDVYRNLVLDPLHTRGDECMKELCMVIDLAVGIDPDIAGIGLMVAYHMEAVLVTVYFLVLTFPRIRRKGRQLIRISTPILRAFQGSLYDLFVAVALLSLGLQLALLQKSTGIIPRTELDSTAFYRTLIRLLAPFAFFPVMILYPLFPSGVKRRSWIRVFSVAVLWVLFLLPLVLDRVSFLKFVAIKLFLPVSQMLFFFNAGVAEDNNRPNFLDLFCRKKEIGGPGLIQVISGCTWIVLGGPVLGMLATAFGKAVVWIRGSGTVKSSPPVPLVFLRSFAAVITTLAALIGMWLILGVVTAIRWQSASIEGVDQSRKGENHWNFGQILAVATWIPVLLEFGFILIFGMKIGLQGRMPIQYEAVEMDDPDENLDVFEKKTDDDFQSSIDEKDVPTLVTIFPFEVRRSYPGWRPSHFSLR